MQASLSAILSRLDRQDDRLYVLEKPVPRPTPVVRLARIDNPPILSGPSVHWADNMMTADNDLYEDSFDLNMDMLPDDAPRFIPTISPPSFAPVDLPVIDWANEDTYLPLEPSASRRPSTLCASTLP